MLPTLRITCDYVIKNSDYVATNFAMTYKWIVSISMKDNHFNVSFLHKNPPRISFFFIYIPNETGCVQI
jgi:hypothetical protein